MTVSFLICSIPWNGTIYNFQHIYLFSTPTLVYSPTDLEQINAIHYLKVKPSCQIYLLREVILIDVERISNCPDGLFR